ncbi:MAG: uL15 family ribosomal protein [Candidatus Vogelbacteria bacterium]|nr:uL15 family ribosomal protein [Candidatus Vogelbacteria bacterium]
MQIHQVKRLHKNKSKKIVGRGGKRGTTSGKGTKGQKARSGRKLRPELRDLIKKIPKLRGRGRNSNLPIGAKFQVVNLGLLSLVYNDGEKVNPASLLKKGIIKKVSGKTPKVKILGAGDVAKKLKVDNCLVSDSAREFITKAGGSVE